MYHYELFTWFLLITILLDSTIAEKGKPEGRPRMPCGDKIIGGEVAEKNQFPYQVSMRISNTGQHFCGGTVVHNTYILTASHCVRLKLPDGRIYPLKISDFYIVAGEYSLGEDDGTEQRKNISKITVHEDYDPNTLENDITILTLKSALTIDSVSVGKLQLPQRDSFARGLGTASGWGRTTEFGDDSPDSQPDKLMWTRLKILGFLDCWDWSDRVICTKGTKRNNVCSGDSGGPLKCYDSNTKQSYLCGIASYVKGRTHVSCTESYEAGFTNVQEFLPWIEKQVPALKS